jgi:hypothetical protein
MEEPAVASPADTQPDNRELKKQFATWFQAADTGRCYVALTLASSALIMCRPIFYKLGAGPVPDYFWPHDA